MSIGLAFETKVDLNFLSRGISLRLVRLIASVQLKTQNGWTRKYRGVVDTGNRISVIPLFIWRQALIEWLLPQPTKLFGIVRGHEEDGSWVFEKPIRQQFVQSDCQKLPFLAAPTYRFTDWFRLSTDSELFQELTSAHPQRLTN